MNSPAYPPQPVLIIDDDAELQRCFAYALRSHGIGNIVSCTNSQEAEGILAAQNFDLILLDLNMPHLSGRDLLPLIVRKCPDTPVIVITGVDEVATAVQCMRDGSFDYMVKPIDEDTLVAATRRALDVRSVRTENTLLKEHLLAAELSHPSAFVSIITADPQMHALFQYIEAVSVTTQPILITGETGVGKELVAKAIHDCSQRKGRFVAVNIAGLDDNVFSDTLFGHLRGSFTGAVEARKGLIEQAAAGTLFLDEIGELNQASQVKLLRLLQEREYLPIGADNPKYTDTRIVVATNQDLREMQRQGKFREDLFYRLRAHLVRVPPLRERPGDIPLLVEHFMAAAAAAMGKKKPTASADVFSTLAGYHFPGNIRELEGMIYNAVSTLRAGSMMTPAPLVQMMAPSEPIERESVATQIPTPATPSIHFSPAAPLPTIEEAEELMIEEALRRTHGNQTVAAKLLGITRQTLNRYLRRKAGENIPLQDTAEAEELARPDAP